MLFGPTAPGQGPPRERYWHTDSCGLGGLEMRTLSRVDPACWRSPPTASSLKSNRLPNRISLLTSAHETSACERRSGERDGETEQIRPFGGQTLMV